MSGRAANASLSASLPVRATSLPGLPDRKAATSTALVGKRRRSTAGMDSDGRGRNGEEGGGATLSVLRLRLMLLPGW